MKIEERRYRPSPSRNNTNYGDTRRRNARKTRTSLLLMDARIRYRVTHYRSIPWDIKKGTLYIILFPAVLLSFSNKHLAKYRYTQHGGRYNFNERHERERTTSPTPHPRPHIEEIRNALALRSTIRPIWRETRSLQINTVSRVYT